MTKGKRRHEVIVIHASIDLQGVADYNERWPDLAEYDKGDPVALLIREAGALWEATEEVGRISGIRSGKAVIRALGALQALVVLAQASIDSGKIRSRLWRDTVAEAEEALRAAKLRRWR